MVKAEHKCVDCRQVKSISEFYTKVSGHTTGPCKSCILARNRLVKYGVTQQEVDRMVADQGGLCAICDRELGVPYVDHCHISGAVRGALCNECNTGLGMFEDDAERMERAIRYLRGNRD